MHLRPFLAATVLCSASLAAHATSFGVSVSEGLGPSGGFTTAGPAPASYTANATFTYSNAAYTGSSSGYLLYFYNNAAQNAPGTTGDLNSAYGFSTSNITNYSGSGIVSYSGTTVANYGVDSTGTATSPTAVSSALGLSNFLKSSASASNFAYNSYYLFDLGNLVGDTLTLTHDDGVAIYLNGALYTGCSLTSAPTSVTTDSCHLTGSGDYKLAYGRENGTPSILEVKVAATPEPSSIALLGTGLIGTAGVLRRRFRVKTGA